MACRIRNNKRAMFSVLLFGAVLSFQLEIENASAGQFRVASDRKNAGNSLARVKVASLYENITDTDYGHTNIDRVIEQLKGTNTDFIFRGFWKWGVVLDSPENPPSALVEYAGGKGRDFEQIAGSVREKGHYYRNLKRCVSAVKKEMPHVLFCGAIPAQKVSRVEINPVTGRVFTGEDTWAMAFDPGKWDLKYKGEPFTKEEFQKWFNGEHPYDAGNGDNYDRRSASAYFPDITNPEFQKLILSWAKKQIDCGADAVWIDMLYHQVVRILMISKDVNHQAVKESMRAVSYIVDEIHRYGGLKGKYVYVGSWSGPFVLEQFLKTGFPYALADLDFVTVSPENEEILDKKLNREKWAGKLYGIRKQYGDIPVFAFIDWAFDDSQMVAYSQNLTKQEQQDVLRTFDRDFHELGVNFVYPVHGGYMGKGKSTKKLSFGLSRTYNSIAPEFDTYETIKELSNKKK